MDERWQKIQAKLQKTHTKGLYQVWLKPLVGRFDGERLLIEAPNKFVAARVRDRFMGDLRAAVADVVGENVQVSVDHVQGTGQTDATATAPQGNNQTSSGSVPAVTVVSSREEQCGLPVAPAMRGPQQMPSLQPSWRFRFDDFVVGPSNELAHAAAKSLCSNSMPVDQLFLSSGTGLGKTHLLQSVGQELTKVANRAPRIEYLTAEEFASIMVLCLRGNTITQFKERFRDKVDILLLEDVHFLQGKAKIQDEFLATLKALQGRGSKVVLTSSLLPRELKDLDHHLHSRIASGFLAQIDKPDFETRKRIIEAKARVFQVPMQGEVADMLASRIHTDIRQLESCIHSLALKAKLLGRQVSMDMAMDIVGDYSAEQVAINMGSIVDYICTAYGLAESQLGSKSRKRQVVMARNTAFFLARKYTDLSLKDIGTKFNRKHSTVLKGITNVERELSKQTPTGRQLARTIELIEQQSATSV